MIDTFLKHREGLSKAFIETNIMVITSVFVAFFISIVLGTLLYALNKEFLIKNKFCYQLLNIVLNALRSIPFLLFIFVLIPINRKLFGTSYGIIASFIPLVLVTTSILSRFVEQAYLGISQNIIERSISMGASKFQIIKYFLLPTIWPEIVLSMTSTIISTISYSTVMGVIGAGGLGDYAFRYGYQEYNYQLMYITIIIFIIYVFFIQTIGYFITKKLNRYKENSDEKN